MLKKILFIYFLVCVITACKSSLNENSSALPVIDIKKNVKNFRFVNLSEIAENVEYVPLETESNILLRDNIGVRVTDDRYIVYDLACKAFNKKGRFIGNYGSIGKGPGQFVHGRVLGIDQNNNKLFIANYKNILEYSLIDRTFIRSINLQKLQDIEGMSNSFAYLYLGDNIFVNIIGFNSSIQIVSFNDKAEVLNVYPNYFANTYINNSEYFCLNNRVLSIGNKILYKDGLCDTAFYLDKSLTRKPAYLFNLGNKDPYIYLKSLPTGPGYLDEGLLDFIQVDEFLEYNDLLLFTCSFGNQMPESESIPINEDAYVKPGSSARVLGNSNATHCIFNRKTSKLVFLKKTDQYKKDFGGFSGYVNDIDGGVPFWSTNLYKNQLFMAVNAYDLKDYVSSDVFKNSTPKYPEKKEALQRLADSLDYDDNPVIMVVSLKNEKMKE